jgi:hypothetical protein
MDTAAISKRQETGPPKTLRHRPSATKIKSVHKKKRQYYSKRHIWGIVNIQVM